MKFSEGLFEIQADMRALRRDIHAHPELRFEEHRTAALIADRLRKLDLDVSTGIGGTGVVATLRRGSGPAVGLRADMDALPMQEHNDFGHRSRSEGRMHACGHDGHCAMLLAAASVLSKSTDIQGTVHFIFQPAEEGGAGARHMMEAGLFERFPCDAVFGMHNWPGMPVGRFGVSPGAMMASSNEFEIRIEGRGSHAAMPHLGVDPLIVATHLVQALQTVISRNKRPIDAAVLSVTQINAGSAVNVVADDACIRGTVRAFSTEVLDLIEDRIRGLTEALPPAFGARGRLTFQRKYPALINHERHAQFAAEVVRRMAGPQAVDADMEPTMGAEDFAFMLQARPGCYIFVGNGDGAHRDGGHGAGPCMLHNPSYDFNDDLIPIGASYWVELTRAFLSSPP